MKDYEPQLNREQYFAVFVVLVVADATTSTSVVVCNSVTLGDIKT